MRYRIVISHFILTLVVCAGAAWAQSPSDPPPQTAPAVPEQATPAPPPASEPTTSPAPKAGPKRNATSTRATTPAATVAPRSGAPAPVDPNKYVIGVEDGLFIKTWREADFTFPTAVRPDGKITIPLVGEVQAAGLTPQQLEKNLSKALGQYLQNPDVTISITEVRSKKYYIDGEVNHPGTFYLVTPTTVLEALSNASGFHEFANLKKIKILRNNQLLNFNYKEVTNGKHPEQNVYVQNGDHIIVH